MPVQPVTAATRRRIRTAWLAALAFAMLVTSVFPSQTSAFFFVTRTGSIGSVTLPNIYVGDKAPGCAITYGGAQVCPPTLTFWGDVGPTIYRSPAATGRQIVQAKYQVERWNGSDWVSVAESGMLRGEIGASQTGVQLVRPELGILNVARGYFRFSWGISWFSSTGANIGATVINSNLAADHVCVTPARLCQSQNGFVRTGGYLTNSW